MHARRFIRTVLAPHYAKDAEFRQRGIAAPEKLLDFFVFVECKAVLPKRLRRKGRGHGNGHGEAPLSHFAGGWRKQVLHAIVHNFAASFWLKFTENLTSGKIHRDEVDHCRHSRAHRSWQDGSGKGAYGDRRRSSGRRETARH